MDLSDKLYKSLGIRTISKKEFNNIQENISDLSYFK